jgi:transposase
MEAVPVPTRTPYPSDLTDEEWTVLAPDVPAATAGGRPADHAKRELLNGLFSVLRSGCAWRMLPHDFPPWQSVDHDFRVWQQDGTWLVMHDVLRGDVRVAAGRHRQPSAGSIESQAVKTTETGGSAALMPTNTSRGASAISLSIREGCCSPWLSQAPTCKTVWPPKACSHACGTSAPVCGVSGPIRPIQATSPLGCGRDGPGGRSALRWSNGLKGSRASCSCPNGGSSSGRSRGEAATAVYPKMMNTERRRARR